MHIKKSSQSYPKLVLFRAGEVNESNPMGSKGQLAETFAELQKAAQKQSACGWTLLGKIPFISVGLHWIAEGYQSFFAIGCAV